MRLALDFNGVTKRFGPTVAVDGLNLQLEEGGFMGLVGRNGAGKTTTINLATTILRPTGGRLRVFGLDTVASSLEVRRQIGVMPQEDASFDFLSAREYLGFVGGAYGLADAAITSRTDELFELLDFGEPPGALLRELSWGTRKKVALCAAILHGPRVVFLDEPLEGIDPVTGRTIKDLLATLHGKGVTIVMSSHVLEVVERMCATVAILDAGRLLAVGTPDELRGSHRDAPSLEELFVQLSGGAKAGDVSWI